MLSHRLPVLGLVSRYPTNYLIGREPLLRRPKAFILSPRKKDRMRDYPQFPEAIPHRRVCYSRVTQPSATCLERHVRLACIKRAASVRPEPGSNSPTFCSQSLSTREKYIRMLLRLRAFFLSTLLLLRSALHLTDHLSDSAHCSRM